MAEVDDIINDPSESEKRIKQLSGQAKLAAEERDKAKAAEAAALAAAEEAKRTAEFFQSFSDIVATHPNAKDHRDDILAKVKGGYTVEDATFAVLGKAGKLNTPEPEVIAGGSSTTNPQPTGPKSVQEMTQDERRELLTSEDARLDQFLRHGM